MCSSCNKPYSEWRKSEDFKYLENEQIQLILLRDILKALHEMKQQEFDYWETWKQAKKKDLLDEQQTKEAERQT